MEAKQEKLIEKLDCCIKEKNEEKAIIEKLKADIFADGYNFINIDDTVKYNEDEYNTIKKVFIAVHEDRIKVLEKLIAQSLQRLKDS
jgi:hypothetical protein